MCLPTFSHTNYSLTSICPNHRSQVTTIFFTIDAISNCPFYLIPSNTTTDPTQHFHICYTYLIWWFTSSISSSFWPWSSTRYLNRLTCSMTWSSTFASMLEMFQVLLRLLMSWLLRQKTDTYKACLHVFNLLFNISLDSPSRTISFAKIMEIGSHFWVCFLSTSKTKVSR